MIVPQSEHGKTSLKTRLSDASQDLGRGIFFFSLYRR